ncbi:MAG: type IV toxin-antitoxin system AbiEi family antitoxin [Deltaproteobacteria bacterium]|nr:type IV toxin-antitoxin system AbiEi family antitoxin [Deltaproteobacteria bacterium]
MKAESKSLADWVNQRQKSGLYAFTRSEVLQQLELRPGALAKALQRLSVAGRVACVRKGFYVIVPLEYQAIGSVPAEWFIDDLMRFIGQPYYVGCLSAAAIHGAAHQRPQEQQVVVPAHVRMVDKKAVRIRFLHFTEMDRAITQPWRTHTGDIPISTPEWTAIDLIRFQRHYGSMDAAATVLTELGEALDAQRLADAAYFEKCNAYLQRLGWMLDFVGFKDVTANLHSLLEGRKPSFVALRVENHRISVGDGCHGRAGSAHQSHAGGTVS